MNSSLSLSVRFNVEEYIFDWVFEKVPCRVIYRKRTFEDSSLEKGRSRQHSGSLSFLPACAVPQGGGFPGLTAVSWFAALPVAVCTGTWSLQLPLLLRRVIPAPDLLNVFWMTSWKQHFDLGYFFFFWKQIIVALKLRPSGWFQQMFSVPIEVYHQGVQVKYKLPFYFFG